MTEDIDLSEIDKKYKDKCSLIKAGKCKNVNIFLQQSRENAELKAENERLNRCMMEALHHEGERIRETIKYKQTLQEIKKYIAKICKEECGYVQKKRCPDCDCRFGAILDLITKTEEE